MPRYGNPIRFPELRIRSFQAGLIRGRFDAVYKFNERQSPSPLEEMAEFFGHWNGRRFLGAVFDRT